MGGCYSLHFSVLSQFPIGMHFFYNEKNTISSHLHSIKKKKKEEFFLESSVMANTHFPVVEKSTIYVLLFANWNNSYLSVLSRFLF